MIVVLQYWLYDCTVIMIVNYDPKSFIVQATDLTGQNLGRVFNFRLGQCMPMHLRWCETKQPNLKLKAWPKQLLGFLPQNSSNPKNRYNSGFKFTNHFHMCKSRLGWAGTLRWAIVAEVDNGY